jgi:hypothetical protein
MVTSSKRKNDGPDQKTLRELGRLLYGSEWYATDKKARKNALSLIWQNLPAYTRGKWPKMGPDAKKQALCCLTKTR